MNMTCDMFKSNIQDLKQRKFESFCNEHLFPQKLYWPSQRSLVYESNLGRTVVQVYLRETVY